MQPKEESSTEPVIVTTFSFPAPTNSHAQNDLNFMKCVSEFRDKLSTSGRYSLVVRVFGEDFDIGSVPQQVSEEWVMKEPPTDVSYKYNSANQNDTLTVSCSTVPHVSSYTLAVMNMQHKHLVISATVQGSRSISTVFKGEDIEGKGGDKFQCLAQSLGDSGSFNSKWTLSSAVLERLASPTPIKVIYGRYVEDITLTYSAIPNTKKYFYELTATDDKYEKQYSIQHYLSGRKPSTKATNNVEVTLPINGSLTPDSKLRVKAIAIAHENTNSMSGFYVSPPIRKMESPPRVSSSYDLPTGTMLVKWSSVKDCNSYSLELLQKPLTIVDERTNIPENRYDYSLFPPHVSSSNHYRFVIVAHSTDCETPVFPSEPSYLQSSDEWEMDDIVANPKMEEVVRSAATPSTGWSPLSL